MTTANLSLKVRFPLSLRLLVAAAVLLVSGFAASGEQALIKPAQVAGPPSTEDLLAIPDSSWVLASAVSIGPEQVPGLYVLSNDPPHLEMLHIEVPDQGGTATCSAPLDQAGFSPLGVALRSSSDDDLELLVINRGSRKAIEVFTMAVEGRVPVLSWRDCIPLPDYLNANSIAPHPDGGFLVTQSFDPRDGDNWARQERGEKTGRLYRWRADTGWSAIPDTFHSGPNGLVVSGDGCVAVFAAWAERRLLRVPLPCGEANEPVKPAATKLPFMPDNLRWTDRGTVLATGQVTTPNKLLDCVRENSSCPGELVVAELDPDAMALVAEWRLDP